MDVIEGVASTCAYCYGRCESWWRGVDFYACVHAQCGELLAACCPALTTRETVATTVGVTTRRRGAYARRAGGVVITPRFIPSRFPIDGAWSAWAQTNTGLSVVPCGGNAGHGVHTVRRWEALESRGYEVSPGGVRLAGAVLRDPSGMAVLSWGHEPVESAPLWEPLTRSGDWSLCRGCQGYVWPGRWVTMAGGRCRLCMADDGRPWPREPDFPGEEWIPDHMREDVPKKRRRRTPKESTRADHA